MLPESPLEGLQAHWPLLHNATPIGSMDLQVPPCKTPHPHVTPTTTSKNTPTNLKLCGLVALVARHCKAQHSTAQHSTAQHRSTEPYHTLKCTPLLNPPSRPPHLPPHTTHLMCASLPPHTTHTCLECCSHIRAQLLMASKEVPRVSLAQPPSCTPSATPFLYALRPRPPHLNTLPPSHLEFCSRLLHIFSLCRFTLMHFPRPLSCTLSPAPPPLGPP